MNFVIHAALCFALVDQPNACEWVHLVRQGASSPSFAHCQIYAGQTLLRGVQLPPELRDRKVLQTVTRCELLSDPVYKP